MTIAATIRRLATGGVVVAAVAGAAAWFAQSQQAASVATAPLQSAGPLMARGYTEAPSGTVMVTNDPEGGALIRELRVREGQAVKRDEVIAVMSNYPATEVSVRSAENSLRKVEQVRARALLGTRQIELALEEDELASAVLDDQLATLRRARAGQPAEERELAVWLAAESLNNKRASLALSKARLAADLDLNARDIEKAKASLENAIRTREQALVRSPIDGVVTQVVSRQGEMVSSVGIAKLVDMNQLRIFATVDELHLGRMKPGAPVQVTFRGSSIIYSGHVVLSPLTVKREKRSEADQGVASVRHIEVEIAADPGTAFPPLLGHEARVTFL